MGTTFSREVELSPEHGFVAGCSEAIQALNATIGEIAGTGIPVLIQGDSGTGKEIYARLIYRLSAQNHKPLTKVSCTMLEPGQLLAYVNRSLQQSNGDLATEDSSALFLDGVDELDVDCQRVLLSMLQERESESGGHVGMRLISTTTRNLENEIQTGRFRRELYFRMAGVCLRLPALRERKEDIPGLMEFFLEKHSTDMGRKSPTLRDDEMELLLNHDWPGNIRELGNLARKIAALGDSKATIAEIRRPVVARGRSAETAGIQSLKTVARTASRLAERDMILKALEKTHWNRKQAARELQISYKALLYKIKQMDTGGSKIKLWQGEER